MSRPNHCWSKDAVIGEILRRDAAGLPLRRYLVVRDSAKLVSAGEKRFGNWSNVLRAAGIDPVKACMPRQWDEQSVINAMWARHAARKALNCAAVARDDSALSNAALRRFKSWDAVLAAAGFTPDDVRRQPPDWTKDRVLNAIRSRHDQCLPLNTGNVKPITLVTRALEFFGSWDSALSAAGINPALYRTHERWSADLILAKIRERMSDGKPLTWSAVQREYPHLVAAGQRYFGSWRAALGKAGLDPEKIQVHVRRWTRSALIHRIRQRFEQDSNPEYDHKLCHAAWRVFGSWKAALRAAGIVPVRPKRAVVTSTIPAAPKLRRWTPKRVVLEIRKRSAEGKPLHVAAVQKADSSLVWAAIKHCGSWDKALTSAGLDPTGVRVRRPPWTLKEIVQQVLKRKADRQALDCVSMRPASMCSAVQHAGGWARVLQMAGINPKGICKLRWTAKMVIAGIRARKKRKAPLNSTAVARSDSRLWSAGSKHFGNWSNALKAAGYDPDAIAVSRRPWTAEGLIALVRESHSQHKSMGPYSFEASGYHAARRIFGSWRGLLQAADLPVDKIWHPRVDWTRSSLITAIRTAVARQKEGKPARYSTSIYRAARRLFGSWSSAVKAAGVQISVRWQRTDKQPVQPRGGWTKTLVIRGILDRERLGLSLRRFEVRKDNRALCVAAVRLFRSWSRALRAAGLQPEKIVALTKWNECSVLNAVWARHAAGKPMNSLAMQGEDAKLHRAAERRFGSWDAALNAAGLQPADVRLQSPPWTQDRILLAIKEKAATGQPLNAGHLKPHGLLNRAIAEFGSWDKAIEAAGQKPEHHRQTSVWNEERVLNEVRLLIRKRRPLNSVAVQRKNATLIYAAHKYLGSWDEALRRAGVDPESTRRCRRTWTRAEVIDTVRGYADPVTSIVKWKPEYATFSRAAKRLFGSWQAALAAAGARPERRRQQHQ